MIWVKTELLLYWEMRAGETGMVSEGEIFIHHSRK